MAKTNKSTMIDAKEILDWIDDRRSRVAKSALHQIFIDMELDLFEAKVKKIIEHSQT